VVSEYRRPADTSAQSEGSLQTLPNGNRFVGFGAQPFFSEFTAGGRLLFDATLPQDDGSYRAYRFPWRATPRTRPDVVVQNGAVYVSWNGATDVARWQVLAGGSVVASARKTGFETRIALPSSASTVTVRALNAKGHVLATSGPAS
jgi:hypothetical protein